MSMWYESKNEHRFWPKISWDISRCSYLARLETFEFPIVAKYEQSQKFGKYRNARQIWTSCSYLAKIWNFPIGAKYEHPKMWWLPNSNIAKCDVNIWLQKFLGVSNLKMAKKLSIFETRCSNLEPNLVGYEYRDRNFEMFFVGSYGGLNVCVLLISIRNSMSCKRKEVSWKINRKY